MASSGGKSGQGQGKSGGGAGSGGNKARSRSSVTRVSTNNGRRAGGASTVPANAGTAEVGAATSGPVRRKFFTRRNIFLIIAGIVVLVGAGVTLFILNEINKSLPTINGTVQLPGLTANVTVTRDKNGVPHIEASNLQDLYMAQGYVHAQDRLYQMFFFRTAGEGRLAELFSPDLVTSDRYLRVVGFRRAAEAELANMRADVRQGLQWYADGVNAFVHTHQDKLPVEFSLLGVKFEDWQPVDSVAFGKLQARDLTETWQNEIVKSDLVQKLGPEVAAQLLPGYPGDAPVTVPDATGTAGDIVAQYNKTIVPLLGAWSEDIGSNNWVVDGTKSATGKPLLSNDPHLGVRNPSIWYEIHLTITNNDYDAVGFGFAGAPGIVSGHNKNIAWGVTNTGADVQDVFLEQLDDVNHPGMYKAGDNWLPMQVLTETIKVSGAEPYTQVVRITNHGPILTDAFPITPTISSSITGTYSLQWTALRPGTLLEAVFDLQTARDWTDFRRALSRWDVPGQNFVYADKEGNIGYQMTGQVPVRKKGDGSLAEPGWTGEYDWQGFVPFDKMPNAYNPPEHFIATANNKPYGAGYTPEIPGYWAMPWRIDRIRELLTAKDKLGIADYQAILSDTTSVLAKQVAPVFAGAPVTDTRTLQAVDLLKNWDGNVRADSAAAAIYEVTYHQVLTRTFGDELGRSFSDTEAPTLIQYFDTFKGEALQSIANLLKTPDDPLWDDLTTPKTEKRDDILAASLTAAVTDLTGAMGDNMADWQWGKLHVVAPAHEFSNAQLVGGLFTLPTEPIGGDNSTVSVGSYDMRIAAFPTQPFPITGHQSYRMIIDLSDWNNSLAIFQTGESGQPGSKFRDNMYQPWLNYQYFPLYYDKAQIDANKEGVLTLTP